MNSFELQLFEYLCSMCLKYLCVVSSRFGLAIIADLQLESCWLHTVSNIHVNMFTTDPFVFHFAMTTVNLCVFSVGRIFLDMNVYLNGVILKFLLTAATMLQHEVENISEYFAMPFAQNIHIEHYLSPSSLPLPTTIIIKFDKIFIV